MKQFWKEAGIALILGMILPGIILRIASGYHSGTPQETVPATQEIIQQTSPMMICVLSDGTAAQMELEEYLTGVVLAEMPASFETEALKAQSVVARTYTLRANDGKSKHENAAVCMDSACCQAYVDPADYLRDGGTVESVEKVRRAVQETAGLVLTYEGDLIEATYFSCSGGSTEDAVAVWGADVPYLQATPSPGEEAAAHYSDSVTFTAAELAHALELDLSGTPSEWFGSVQYTAGGGVDTMIIGEKQFRGTELRKLLGLRSTAFTVTAGESSATFHTRGYGHRVGMSQYGADAMAVTGSSYEDILSHYYRGTVLQKYGD